MLIVYKQHNYLKSFVQDVVIIKQYFEKKQRQYFGKKKRKKSSNLEFEIHKNIELSKKKRKCLDSMTLIF
jgi:hypothetical protein